MRLDEIERPKILDKRGVLLALAVHAGLLLVGWIVSLPIRERETVIPIELTFEAPPDEVAPLPPPPKTDTLRPPPTEPPKIDDKLDAVEKIPPKEKVKPPKEKPKPPKEKPKPAEVKPKPPKEKTTKELQEERMARIRGEAKVVKNPKPPPVAGTGQKLDPKWRERLNEGFKPGARTTVPASEAQRCLSLIRRAYYDKWERPAWMSSLKEMRLEISIGAGGTITGYRLVSSSGDTSADRSVISAAGRVKSVGGLSAEFIRDNPKVIVNFKVTPQ